MQASYAPNAPVANRTQWSARFRFPPAFGRISLNSDFLEGLQDLFNVILVIALLADS